MPFDLKDRFVVALSTRALFDMAKENQIFETKGSAAYNAYQLEREGEPLLPGAAFPLARALLSLNKFLPAEHAIEIVLISRNSGEAAVRISKSISHYDLPISRSVFTSGDDVTPYLHAFSVDLFLSAFPKDVQSAHESRVSAALIFAVPRKVGEQPVDQIRIAFDGDSVLFSEDSERLYQAEGVSAFHEHEAANANVPLADGPFARVVRRLGRLQQVLPKAEAGLLKVALVTARNAPADERVLKTLRKWRVRVDHSIFLGGVDKVEALNAFRPHIFFDDQMAHLVSASSVIPTGCVPSAVFADLGNIPCPKCGTPMVRRVASKKKYEGKPFLGCGRYPLCTKIIQCT